MTRDSRAAQVVEPDESERKDRARHRLAADTRWPPSRAGHGAGRRADKPGERLYSRLASALSSASFHSGNWRRRNRRKRSRKTRRPLRLSQIRAGAAARSSRNICPSRRANRSTVSSSLPLAWLPEIGDAPREVARAVPSLEREARAADFEREIVGEGEQLFAGFEQGRLAARFEESLNGREVLLGGGHRKRIITCGAPGHSGTAPPQFYETIDALATLLTCGCRSSRMSLSPPAPAADLFVPPDILCPGRV